MKLTEKDLRRFERFLRRDPATGCLLFTGCLDRWGYGEFYLGGAMVGAHRVAFVAGGGIITPEKPFVLHACPGGDDRPACCEFKHLWAGTHKENVRDMALKGRGTKNQTGLPFGVSRHNNGYMAQVRVLGRQTYLGTFPTVEEAAAVAMAAKLFPGDALSPGADLPLFERRD